MPVQTILLDQWSDFFNDLNGQHQGMLASIEALPQDLDPVLVAFDEPFVSVDLEQDGSHAIVIRLETITYRVDAPVRLQAQPFADGGGQILDIESAISPRVQLYVASSHETSTGRGGIYGGRDTPQPADRPDTQRGRGDRSQVIGDASDGADRSSYHLTGSLGDQDLADTGRESLGDLDDMQLEVGLDSAVPGPDLGGYNEDDDSRADR